MAAHPDLFDCAKCRWRHCSADNPAPVALWEIDGERFTVCPKGLITQESVAWLKWHSHYLHNFLPAAGGMLDQASAFVEAMEIISAAKANIYGGQLHN